MNLLGCISFKEGTMLGVLFRHAYEGFMVGLPSLVDV